VTNLHRILEDYLAMRRSLGYKLVELGRYLPDFVRYLERVGSPFITAKDAVEWARLPSTATPSWWGTRLRMARIFAKYVHTLDPRTEIPSADLLVEARQKRTTTPYLYSQSDVESLMEAAQNLRAPLISSTYSVLFGLLSVTGMRVGEAMSLDCKDVDFGDGVITIRGAKFGKTREVMLHSTTQLALRSYVKERMAKFPKPSTSSFFVSSQGNRLTYPTVHWIFRRLVHWAGMEDRKPRRPQIHDLRHSFAVRTLLNWYRAGIDVQAYLPRLSTYLGHVLPSSTYWYLTATPELLALAMKRLEKSQEERP
jgi:integrase/recombinase XerD